MPPRCAGVPRPFIGLLFACATLCWTGSTRAQHATAHAALPVAAAGSTYPPRVKRAPQQPHDDPRYDPYGHDLRIGLFPIHFMASLSDDHHFGSSARAEIDVMPRVALAAWGRLAWGRMEGPPTFMRSVRPASAFGFGAGLRYFFIDSTVSRSASGTVYPRDPGIPQGANSIHTATGDDLAVPVNQRMGGPQMRPYEVDDQAVVPMRAVHSLRLGYDFAGGLQEGRDGDAPGEHPLIDNRLHMVHLGWGMGSHWNLPASATGQRELGFRHVYVDVLLSMPALANEARVEAQLQDGFDPTFMPVGLRLGTEGALDALIDAWEGLGLAYKLEGGALPGYSGLEAYVYIAFGVELDAATGTNGRLQRSR